MKNLKIMEGAGPFSFEGSELGVLAIHGGGGGTAADLLPLARELHEKGGYTVNLPLLPGYGTIPEELRETPIEEWISFLEREISALQQHCSKIIVGGHSMGGILTLILAAQHDLDAIFTISTPIGLKGMLHRLVPFFKLFIKYHAVDSEQFKKDTDGKWVGYDKIPLNIAPKIKKLIKIMRNSLSKVQAPAIMFQGRLDSVIKSNSMETLFNNINSETKKKIWLEHQDHPILHSPDHRTIVLKLISFINEHLT